MRDEKWKEKGRKVDEKEQNKIKEEREEQKQREQRWLKKRRRRSLNLKLQTFLTCRKNHHSLLCHTVSYSKSLQLPCLLCQAQGILASWISRTK